MEFLNGKKLSSPSIVDEFEQRVGIRFPEVYRSVALQNDGASLYPGRSAVWNPRLGRNEFISCNALIPFEEDGNGEPTMSEVNFESTDIPEHIIAFGIEAGGYLFALDYRSGADPSVVLLHFGDMIEYEAQILPVAPSFEEFLANLQPRPDQPESP